MRAVARGAIGAGATTTGPGAAATVGPLKLGGGRDATIERFAL